MSRLTILYVRLPGLLCRAAQRHHNEYHSLPCIVTEGRLVRDACCAARQKGIDTGQSLTTARRLCPHAIIVPLTEVDAQPESRHFLDRIADFCPAIEPISPDTFFATLQEQDAQSLQTKIARWCRKYDLPEPYSACAPSKIAARACAECRLPFLRLGEADSDYLWPEDVKVTARLKRLGLVRFEDVAHLSESLLVHQFGKIGRVLHRRAQGIDLAPVLPLYPPPRADVRLDLSEYPASNAMLLHKALSRVAARAAGQLTEMNRHGRRVLLRLTTEKGEVRRERVLSLPVQSDKEVQQVILSLLSQMRLSAPVLSVRLIVDDTELPVAKTLTLFADRTTEGKIILNTVRRVLQAKFGTKALLRLSEMPVPVRDERRTLMKEAFPSR